MARLPQPGGDDGNWGEILNEYLSESLTSAGKIKLGAVTKADVGLGNVDNTSDASKPVSTATQAALDQKVAGSALDGLTASQIQNNQSQTTAALSDFTEAVVDERTPLVLAQDPAIRDAAATALTTAMAVDSVANAFAPRERTDALALLNAALSRRNQINVGCVFCGSSTTAGNGATTGSRRYVNRLISKLQADLPLELGSHPPMMALAEAIANPPTAIGIQGINAGVGGTTSTDFITPSTREQIITLAPAAIFIMVGSNDMNAATTPTAYRSTMLAQIAPLRAALPNTVIVLVQQHERYNAVFAYKWSDYAAALHSIAKDDPTRIAFLDTSTSFQLIGIPSTDPLGFMQTDKVHLTDPGHEYLAELIHGAVRAKPIAYRPVTLTLTNTTPPTITGHAQPGKILTANVGTWSPEPESFTFQWLADDALILGATGPTFELTDAMVGNAIRVRVTARRANNLDSVALSATKTVQPVGDIVTGLAYRFTAESVRASFADGADVTGWSSIAGSVPITEDNAASNKPSIRHAATPSGKAALVLQGSNSEQLRTFASSGPVITNPATYVAVVKRASSGSSRILSGRSNSAYHMLGIASGGGVGMYANSTTVGATDSTSIVGEWVIVIGTTSDTMTTVQVNHRTRINGTGITGASNSGTTTGANAGSTAYFDGEIAEKRCYTRVLTQNDIDTLVDALATEYGITV